MTHDPDPGRHTEAETAAELTLDDLIAVALAYGEPSEPARLGPVQFDVTEREHPKDGQPALLFRFISLRLGDVWMRPDQSISVTGARFTLDIRIRRTGTRSPMYVEPAPWRFPDEGEPR